MSFQELYQKWSVSRYLFRVDATSSGRYATRGGERNLWRETKDRGKGCAREHSHPSSCRLKIFAWAMICHLPISISQIMSSACFVLIMTKNRPKADWLIQLDRHSLKSLYASLRLGKVLIRHCIIVFVMQLNLPLTLSHLPLVRS